MWRAACMVLGFGASAAGTWLHQRGKLIVDIAEARRIAAAKTDDASDDKLAELEVAKAKANQQFLDALATALSKPCSLMDTLFNKPK